MNTAIYWVVILASGALFGFGLSFSTMLQPEVVLSFLRFEDFGLLLVLGSATGLTMLIYQLAPGILKKPFLVEKFSSKPDGELKKTLIGAMIFGIGWGLAGVCPGPAIAGIGAGNWPVIYALIAMLGGAYVQGRWFSGN
ncbi:MAG: YeeE/YedE family protein [Cycloclasticus sp. symbiont of Bathymodiolus heckerae]|nr:MAG: YeeE/YedE family protein [Cycloclasticus sp. symbiont of Bathymodiolus heckerae]